MGKMRNNTPYNICVTTLHLTQYKPNRFVQQPCKKRSIHEIKICHASSACVLTVMLDFLRKSIFYDLSAQFLNQRLIIRKTDGAQSNVRYCLNIFLHSCIIEVNDEYVQSEKSFMLTISSKK